MLTITVVAASVRLAGSGCRAGLRFALRSLGAAQVSPKLVRLAQGRLPSRNAPREARMNGTVTTFVRLVVGGLRAPGCGSSCGPAPGLAFRHVSAEVCEPRGQQAAGLRKHAARARDGGTDPEPPSVVAYFCARSSLNDGLERLDDFVALDPGLGEPQLQLEGFGGGLVAEDERLRAAGFGFGGLFADVFARRAAFAGDFFDQGDHFLGVSLPNYL